MPPEIIRSTESQPDYKRAAFVAPGQASQKVGMGQELYNQSEAAREVFKEVNDALGFPLSDIMFHGPPEALQDTVNAQPAVYTLGLATLKALEEQSGNRMIMPKTLAGHSVGIYPTLVIAGMTDVGNGARLVRKRGELMHEASLNTQGTMAAIIGLNQSEIEFICEQTGIELANINTDDQMVISGEKNQIANALNFAHRFASARGIDIRRIPLPVSGAFHSYLMAPAQPELEEYISRMDLKDPSIPIIANSSARPLTTANEVRHELVNGLCLPVNWRDSVRFMAEQGTRTFIELGPKVLTSMVQRIDHNLHTFTVDSFESAQKLAQLLQQPANRSNPLNA